MSQHLPSMSFPPSLHEFSSPLHSPSLAAHHQILPQTNQALRSGSGGRGNSSRNPNSSSSQQGGVQQGWNSGLSSRSSLDEKEEPPAAYSAPNSSRLNPAPVNKVSKASRAKATLMSSLTSDSGNHSPLFIQNTTGHDRKLLVKKALMARLARERNHGLVGLSTHRRRYFWRSPFTRKEPRLQLLFIQHPNVFPVVSRHLAARAIQHWWHRFHAQQRTKRSAMKAALARSKGFTWVHPYKHWQRAVASALAKSKQKIKPQNLSSTYFLETGLYATHVGATSSSSGSNTPAANTYRNYTGAYKDWCVNRIAAAWFRYRAAKRYRAYAIRPVFSYAAIDIQRAWREFQRRKLERGDPLRILHNPARTIQRAYRRFTQRRIYQYFRDLILARQNSNPYLLLKLLNPREGTQLHDHCSGLYIRFRLGGNVFPPILYYKTFTNMSVTDINSFAPRDYARDRKMERELVHVTSTEMDGNTASGTATTSSIPNGTSGSGITNATPTDRAYWYRRYENNGWRPIVNDSVLAERDPVHERTAARTTVFHPNKLVRRMDVLRKRKGKKIEWLKKMYASGVIALPTAEEIAAKRAAAEEKQESLDSDEEEWNNWKARNNSASAGTFDADPQELLESLSKINTADPRALLSNADEWEDEAEQLLDWCSGLADFESYSNTWLTTATSRPNDKSYRLVNEIQTTADAVAAQQRREATDAVKNSTTSSGAGSFRKKNRGKVSAAAASAAASTLVRGMEPEGISAYGGESARSNALSHTTGGSGEMEEFDADEHLNESATLEYGDSGFPDGVEAAEHEHATYLALQEENAGLPAWIGESQLKSVTSQQQLMYQQQQAQFASSSSLHSNTSSAAYYLSNQASQRSLAASGSSLSVNNLSIGPGSSSSQSRLQSYQLDATQNLSQLPSTASLNSHKQSQSNLAATASRQQLRM